MRNACFFSPNHPPRYIAIHIRRPSLRGGIGWKSIIMSAYLKGAVASVPGHLRSLQPSSYLKLPQLPSTTGLQNKTNSLHSRNPKALIIFLVLVFFLFWRNIIFDVCSHFVHRIPSTPVETNPIKNDTLGVGRLIALFTFALLMKKCSSKRSLSYRYQREATGEHLCSPPPMAQISHSQSLTP